MFARIEIAVRPDSNDSAAQSLLKRIELTNPQLRRQIRWARYLDVYWMDLPVSREELIPALSEICWDRVLQWVFTGNLMPAAAGKTGGLQDLMEVAPFRPGRFCGVERRFRPGVTDYKGRSLIEALEIVLGKKLPQSRASSGGLFVMEGPGLDEDAQTQIARDILCNETLETWTLVNEDGLKKNERFHQERVKYDLPRIQLRGTPTAELIALTSMQSLELERLSQHRQLALSLSEMKAIQTYFDDPRVREKRAVLGLNHTTDVELEMIARIWSERSKNKIFNAEVQHGGHAIDGLFQTYIAGTTAQLTRPWLLSSGQYAGGICAFDEESVFCVQVEACQPTAALEPFGGALTGMLGVNRSILGCGLGAKPIFNTSVLCFASPESQESPPDHVLHPRRILDGIRRGVEQAGNQIGVPTVNGATVVDDRFLGAPLVFCGSGGLMPRIIAGESSDLKKIVAGDRICMVGGRVGKDGIYSATLSSGSGGDQPLTSSVQLGDAFIQKRMSDFLIEARDLGLYRSVADQASGSLSLSVGEMAKISGGARVDTSQIKTKYSGIKLYELMVSESQERMTVAVPPLQLSNFLALAERRGVEISDIGEFSATGYLDIFHGQQAVGSLHLKFLHEGLPRRSIVSSWTDRPASQEGWLKESREDQVMDSFKKLGNPILLGLMGRPNIASKEWLIRQYDHEAQGTSVVKPLHTTAVGTARAFSGPNDAGVILPKIGSDRALVVGCGLQPKLSDIDPFLMAQAGVDEAVRNVLCVGAEYGSPESVLGLVENFCWPDPGQDPEQMGSLVRACQGLQEAALALSTPLISGKHSFKGIERGKRMENQVSTSLPPTLLMTAISKMADAKQARTADFKSAGDIIYLLGHSEFGLLGTELSAIVGRGLQLQPSTRELRVGRPLWSVARKVYSWMGGAQGKQQYRLKSLHDVSEGGLLVAVAECLLSRGMGASIWLPPGRDPWEFAFGEGFHAFVGSVAPEDAPPVETEWDELGIPFQRIGVVEAHDRMETYQRGSGSSLSQSQAGHLAFTVTTAQLRAAWSKEGYWE